ncbi:D(2) dopamine receptor-like [Patiria miniata]|uniref:G-protein coupled receptors family 1 profile domain-containing protein n=1 Tax=Patiria miniata TaxID=46514 RepID=A0A914B3E2_PATMI|nr:D(2) dopamine receptor-like [Patiria miniata]
MREEAFCSVYPWLQPDRSKFRGVSRFKLSQVSSLIMEAFLWPLVIFHIIVGVVGLPGNALIVLVYGRKRQMMSHDVFILALAVADLMVCLFTPVTVYHWFISRSYTSGLLCRLVLTMTFVTVYNSSYLTTAIAVDRYRAICRPHRRCTSTVRRAKITAALCLTLALISSIPVFVSYDVQFENPSNETGICTANKNVPSWVHTCMHSVTYTSSLSTLAITIVFYGKVYFFLRKRAAVGLRPNQVAPNEAAATPGASHDPSPLALNALLDANGSCYRVYNPVSRISQQSPSTSQTVANPSQGAGAGATQLFLAHRQVVRNPEPPKRQAEQGHPGQLREKQEQETSIKRISTINARVDAGIVTNHLRPARPPQVQLARRHGKTTKMLVITTVVFFSTWMLALCLVSILHSSHAQLYNSDKIGYAILYLLSYSFYLNNAVNPFIYAFVNRKFREDCRKTLAAMRPRCLRN